jgi:hypothetical protein
VGFFRFRGDPKRQIKKGETTMANNNGNQVREDEIVVLTDNRDRDTVL